MIEQAGKKKKGRHLSTNDLVKRAIIQEDQANYQAAEELLQLAAEKGEPTGLFAFGCFYRNRGSLSRAKFWFRLAALKGEHRAQCSLGFHYHFYEPDLQKAIKWYQLAAEQGNAKAQNNLATLVEVDQPKEAENWYRKSALQDHGIAMFNLAKSLYHRGILEEAKKWFICSEGKGVQEAPFFLGCVCEDLEEFAEAKFWYQKANRNGSRTSLFYLARIKQRLVHEMGSKI